MTKMVETTWQIRITVGGIERDSIPGLEDEAACREKWADLRSQIIGLAKGQTLYAAAFSPAGKLIVLEDTTIEV